jgi:membrane fusion protein (multidrug efflux system)
LVQLDDTELQAQRQRLIVQQNLNQKISERLQALYEKEGVSLQEYEVAKAEVEKVKAEIALVDAQLDKRIIRAPFSGVLGLRMVSEGSYLSPGTAIVNLVNINPIKIEFAVPEKYSRSVGPGTEVTFKLDGRNETYRARVMATEPTIDADTRTFLLKASAPNPQGQILPGAFANVTVNLQEYAASIMIPTEAVIPELGGKKVFVARNGMAQSVEVETGIRQEATIQVLSGLSEGDTLITSGILQLRNGAPVDLTIISD